MDAEEFDVKAEEYTTHKSAFFRGRKTKREKEKSPFFVHSVRSLSPLLRKRCERFDEQTKEERRKNGIAHGIAHRRWHGMGIGVSDEEVEEK